MTTTEKVLYTIKADPHPVLAFSNLIEPRQYKGKGKFQYDARLVFTSATHPDVVRVKELAAQVASTTFPAAPLGQFILPWKTGEQMVAEAAEGVARGNKPLKPEEWLGTFNIAVRSEYQPEFGMIENSRLVKFEGQSAALAEKHIFRGQHVGGTVEIVAYFVDGRYYIKLYPKDIVSFGGGQRRGGGSTMMESYSEYTGHATDRAVGQGPATPW